MQNIFLVFTVTTRKGEYVYGILSVLICPAPRGQRLDLTRALLHSDMKACVFIRGRAEDSVRVTRKQTRALRVRVDINNWPWAQSRHRRNVQRSDVNSV